MGQYWDIDRLSKYTKNMYKKSREKNISLFILCYYDCAYLLLLFYFQILYFLNFTLFVYIIPNKRNMSIKTSISIPSIFNIQCISYTKLFTYINVHKHNIFIKTNYSKSAKNEIIQRILDIWTNASLPTYSANTLHKKLLYYIVIINKLFKSYRHKNYKNYCQQHYENFKILFDICTWKCSVNTICRCERNVRVSVARAAFLLDQRTERSKSIQVIQISTSILSKNPESQPSTSQASYQHSLVTNNYYSLLLFTIDIVNNIFF